MTTINKKEISVLISVYYKESPIYFRRCLDSILNQTLTPDEIVIVKDGPLTKELDLVLEEFTLRNSLFKIIPLPQNKGLSNALNIGLKNCSSHYVARMDTDDTCHLNRLSLQYDYLEEHPEIDILGSFAKNMDQNDKLGNEIKVPVGTEKISDLIWTSPIIHASIMFRKDKILSIGSYNPNSGPRQDDYELWFRCIKNNLKIDNLPIPLYYIRFFEEVAKKNNIRVGFYRLKVGFKGCRDLNFPIKAYIGVFYPFIRSLFPYPINIYISNVMKKFDPRLK